MTWYAAHTIIYIKFKDGNQDRYPVYENIILIEAKTVEEAFEKAAEVAKNQEGDSQGSLTYDDRPATHVFAGIRKLINCEDDKDRPNDGTEITYSEFEVESEEAFSKLVNGYPVTVLYQE